MIRYRTGQTDEIEQLKSLLWEYGPNEWNYLTEDGVDEEFALVENRQAEVIVATESDEIVGLAVLIDGAFCPDYLTKYGNLNQIAFVGDVVVAAPHEGKGIATNLLKTCLAKASEKGIKQILIERHEENLASAGMMKKAGFEVIDTFYDPQKRSAGSRNSVICEVKY